MPTYDYQCESCGHRFEAFHGMSAKPVKACPECGEGVRKLMSAGAGVIDKGAGHQVGPCPGHGGHPLQCGSGEPCCGQDFPCRK